MQQRIQRDNIYDCIASSPTVKPTLISERAQIRSTSQHRNHIWKGTVDYKKICTVKVAPSHHIQVGLFYELATTITLGSNSSFVSLQTGRNCEDTSKIQTQQ